MARAYRPDLVMRFLETQGVDATELSKKKKLVYNVSQQKEKDRFVYKVRLSLQIWQDNFITTEASSPSVEDAHSSASRQLLEMLKEIAEFINSLLKV